MQLYETDGGYVVESMHTGKASSDAQRGSRRASALGTPSARWDTKERRVHSRQVYVLWDGSVFVTDEFLAELSPAHTDVYKG